MPRRELLTVAQREAFLRFPEQEENLLQYYTLSVRDLATVRQHRGDHNRLGFAVQLCYLRYPGRVLAENETPPAALLGIVAAQLQVQPALWDEYARRDETRREHLIELQHLYGFEPFTSRKYREVAQALLPLADQTHHAMVLVRAVIEQLRSQQVIIPPLSVIERLCAEAITRAERRLYRKLTSGLSEVQRRALDDVLSARLDTKQSMLAWLRQAPGAANPRNILAHIERLKAIRSIALPAEVGRNIHQNHLLRLARQGAQTAANDFRDLTDERRHATLVAMLLETSATLTDEILDLNDRLLGSAFAKAKRDFEASFQDAGRAINDKVRLYAKVGQALIEAKASQSDPFLAIERIVSWERFTQTVAEAEQLARTEDFDYLGFLGDSYPQVRRYMPTLLETFGFKAAPAAQDVLDAATALREWNRDGRRTVPDDAPRAFVRRRWAPYVFGEHGIDRHYYELCAVSELRNALRAGDVWVSGSRQFKDFEDYLMPATAFNALVKRQELPVAVPTNFELFWNERRERLERELEQVANLAERQELPDAEIREGALKVTPLHSTIPAAAEALVAEAYSMLPQVRITDLLLEVDRWTNFTQHFTHLKGDERAKDAPLLLTAILADAINLGLRKMSAACPGTSYARLSWLAAWYIRDETYSKALAEVVNAQHRQPLAGIWGPGRTASSDGQRFRAGGTGEQGGQINLRYGTEPGVLFYTHISDRFAPFHTKVINANVRDATHVLDGLLYHESDLRIEEHYTDTAGFTDHVFAMMTLLGFRFAPRIRDLADKRLYVPGKDQRFPALAGLIGGTINSKLIAAQWQEVLRLAASIRQGTVTASLILRKLGSYPRQNSLAAALREIGRIERTLFTLEWLQSPDLRRRVQVGLNKGEAKNALARAVFLNRLGEMRDRTFENQRYRASGLNLVVAAIILWNTVYLERAIRLLQQKGRSISDELLAHLSPLGWEHINLTGDYIWHANRRVVKGHFRPLRQPREATVRWFEAVQTNS